jgi:hypothetical protein
MSPLWEMVQEGIDLKSIEWSAHTRSTPDRREAERNMAYSNKVIDHYENPRNVGSLDKNDPTWAPASSAPRRAAT